MTNSSQHQIEQRLVPIGQNQLSLGIMRPASIVDPRKSLIMIAGLPRGSENNAHIALFRPAFLAIAQHLVDLGWTAITMNPPGLGESMGDSFEHNMAGRIADQLELIEYLAGEGLLDLGNVNLLGNSMGGYIAARVAGSLDQIGARCAHLIIISPAAYSAVAETTCFGPDLEKQLNVRQNWLGSPVWTDLKHLMTLPDSHSLLMYMEHDSEPGDQLDSSTRRPIPRDVRQRYEAAIGLDRSHQIANAEHNWRLPDSDLSQGTINQVALAASQAIISQFLVF